MLQAKQARCTGPAQPLSQLGRQLCWERARQLSSMHTHLDCSAAPQRRGSPSAPACTRTCMQNAMYSLGLAATAPLCTT